MLLFKRQRSYDHRRSTFDWQKFRFNFYDFFKTTFFFFYKWPETFYENWNIHIARTQHKISYFLTKKSLKNIGLTAWREGTGLCNENKTLTFTIQLKTIVCTWFTINSTRVKWGKNKDQWIVMRQRKHVLTSYKWTRKI